MRLLNRLLFAQHTTHTVRQRLCVRKSKSLFIVSHPDCCSFNHLPAKQRDRTQRAGRDSFGFPVYVDSPRFYGSSVVKTCCVGIDETVKQYIKLHRCGESAPCATEPTQELCFICESPGGCDPAGSSRRGSRLAASP